MIYIAVEDDNIKLNESNLQFTIHHNQHHHDLKFKKEKENQPQFVVDFHQTKKIDDNVAMLRNETIIIYSTKN